MLLHNDQPDIGQPLSTVQDQEENIDGRLDIHDRRQFELVLDYSIPDAAVASHYRIDTYLFVPNSLDINSRTYKAGDFYKDLQVYHRFREPVLEQGGMAALERIEKAALELKKGGDDVLLQEFHRDIRLFGSAVRAFIRDSGEDVARAWRDQEQEAGSGTRAFLIYTREILERFRRFLGGLKDEPKEILQWAEQVDQFLSFSLELKLTKIIRRIDQAGKRNSPMRNEVADFLGSEQARCESLDYISLHKESSHGRLLAHQGFLKKWVYSILFLKSDHASHVAPFIQITAGIAAGIAMLFSTIAAIWSQQVYGINSAPFVVALVIGYIFKDRIKDWVKTYFAKKANRWFPDNLVHLVDPITGNQVGRSGDSVRWVSADKLTEGVRALREEAGSSDELSQETVLHYSRDVELYGDRIDRSFDGSQVMDILRLHIGRLLTKMDDAEKPVRVYNAQKDRVEKILVPKTYDLNVVIQLWDENRQTTSLQHVVAILNKKGLVDLQDVGRVQSSPVAMWVDSDLEEASD